MTIKKASPIERLKTKMKKPRRKHVKRKRKDFNIIQYYSRTCNTDHLEFQKEKKGRENYQSKCFNFFPS